MINAVQVNLSKKEALTLKALLATVSTWDRGAPGGDTDATKRRAARIAKRLEKLTTEE